MRPDRVVTACAIVAGLVAALAVAPRAQTVLHTFTGSAVNQQFAGAVSDAGDVDADGFADILIGARGDDTVGNDAGAAFVYSGRTGALLWSWHGDAAGDGMGAAVDGAGDVNDDGHADLLVGEYRHNGVGDNSGRAYVFSGATGLPLLTLDGTNTDDEFGVGVAGIGDVNGDDHDDVAIGAHHDDDNGSNSGSVRVVSGATGGQLFLFLGSAGDDLGHVLAGIGDVNGDDVPDLIAGLHDNSQPGQARVYSGADGGVLFNFMGHTNGDFFGHAVAGVGDLDFDEVPDVLIGASQDDLVDTDTGRAWAHSGATGAELYEWQGDVVNDGFGAAVSRAGDWDGDNVPDVIVAIPGADPNGSGSCAARIFSGVDGSALYTYEGTSPGPRFDTDVAGLGDVNGDGRTEVAIGLAYHDLFAVDAGIAVVLSGALPTWTDHGGGIAGSSGVPTLRGQGLLAAGSPGALRLLHAAPSAPALLFISLASTPVPFKGGLLGAFPILLQIPLGTGAGGGLVLPFTWPAGVPAGTDIWFQCAVLDAGASQGVSLSTLVSGEAK